MTQEDKELLLRDLCARLPHGVKLKYVEDLVIKKVSHTITLNNVYLEHIINGDADIKPYLRPMSNMTEEEHKEIRNKFGDCNAVEPGVGSSPWYNHPERDLKNVQFYLRRVPDIVDWLNAHHFDYRGLISKGLALEAPSDMYK